MTFCLRHAILGSSGLNSMCSTNIKGILLYVEWIKRDGTAISLEAMNTEAMTGKGPLFGSP
jgi:hypothetical protein